MYLKELEYIEKIAELKNLTKAAEALNITQSTLSHALKRIETEFNTKLFDRTHTFVALTPAGEIFLGNAKKILHLTADTKYKLGDLENYQKDTLIIGATPLTHKFFLPQYLPKLKEKYPFLKIQLHLGNVDKLQELLKNGTLDCAAMPRVTSEELEAKTLFRSRLLVAMPLNNPLAKYYASRKGHYPEISFAALKNEHFITIAAEHPIKKTFYRLCEKQGFTPHVDIEVNSFYAMLSVVAYGFGVALVPEILLENNPQLARSIAFFGIAEEQDPLEISLVYPKDKYLPKAAAELLTALPH